MHDQRFCFESIKKLPFSTNFPVKHSCLSQKHFEEAS